MLTDVLTGWTAETLGGLTLLAGAAVWGWLRRRTPADPGVAPATAVPGAVQLRTYTLLGVRAADGQPVHLPSSRPASTRVTWSDPTGKREQFELTDAVLPDGTYAAERVSVYPERGAP
ncbi:hypothetical protein OHA84_37420 (plasmid) [Streptomyces sp. NBC_00513]|uniref:hypothetical protein n=1 Tax=unclassified Streptomyces TaxID=2593676 RepID=UPI002258C8AE|nr:hypothetical protein [Streptomyces sp. NBC_00424]MCX5078869.1 hypothetical protein [Streptomyces sp. NBC_00424]WUD46211.1 hypothetical protein OHA84_37420 [Streptomyces sp. NBC_00513]